jgi:DNA-directed RNA polymerase subunit RPC12/RpoP
MSILTTCAACQATFRVKDHLRGKRIRCRQCQAPVLVGGEEPEIVDPEIDVSSIITSTDIEPWHETQDELPLERLSASFGGGRSSASLTSFQRGMLHAARSPGVGLGVIFLMIWVPLSIAEPRLTALLNIVLAAVCAAGTVAGLILDRLRISFENPFELVNDATLGGLAETWLPPQCQGRLSRGASVSAGRRLAKQFGIMGGILMAHTVALWGALLWLAQQ